MNIHSIKGLVAIALAGSLFAASAPARADGMLPETSVVIVNEADGEATITVKNTDDKPALLYTSLENIPEDDENLLLVTPPVARVEAGERQLVRFLLQSAAPLETQRLKRVTFEGIPPKSSDPGLRITMNVRQNLPVIIHPKGLPAEREPWKRLTWSLRGDRLVVNNPSAYVVRLAQTVQLQPSGTTVDIGRTYLLPGKEYAFALPASADSAAQVRLFPATVYGYAVDSYDAPLTAR
ncbi:fimbria/pilus chaperone family protein [Luteimonas sp. R10]|uniref:fimbria/pilus chaperone family protein n=1 Tax=Luteimonas sp. R10 TaxID=3108176 RepID=UPI00308A12DD|nr:fimbria/pilus chaperone family protein [Luteimonas sp. R10]